MVTKVLIQNHFIIKDIKMELIDAVLEWWEVHRYDVRVYSTGDGGFDEDNLYDEEPEFVKIAKIMKEKQK